MRQANRQLQETLSPRGRGSHKRCVILDLEMVNLSPAQAAACRLTSEVLEIGAVMLDAGCAITSTFHALVKPGHATGRYEQRYASLLKASDGKSTLQTRFGRAMVSLCSWIGEEPVDLYMWSQSDYRQLHEQTIWQTSREQREVLLPYLERSFDLQKVFMKALDAVNAPSLDYAMELVHEPFKGVRHHALDDATNTARVFAKLFRSGRIPKELPTIPETIESDEKKKGEVEGAPIAAYLGVPLPPSPPKAPKVVPPHPYGIKSTKKIAFSISSFFTPGLANEHAVLERISQMVHGNPVEEEKEEIPVSPTFQVYTSKFFSRPDGTYRLSHPEITEKQGQEYDTFFASHVASSHFASKRLKDISRAEVLGYCKFLKKRNWGKRQMGMYLLKEVCDQAYKDGLLSFDGKSLGDIPDPFQPIQPQKVEEEPLVQVLSTPWPNETHRVLAQTMAYTGFTLGYLTSLQAIDGKELAGQIDQSKGFEDGGRCLLSSYVEGFEERPFTLLFGETPPTKREVNSSLYDMEKKLGLALGVTLEGMRSSSFLRGR